MCRGSSSLLLFTGIVILQAEIAQLVEQRTENPRVTGSIPVLGIENSMFVLFMREWLSWWSTTLPRSGSRVRVPFSARLSE